MLCMTPPKALFLSVLLVMALSACDQLGIETPDKVAARVEADGKAVGGACRHAGRALEECFENNRRASKTAVYAGWRDMDGYMRENNIAAVKPSVVEQVAQARGNDEPKKTAEAETLKTAEVKPSDPALHDDKSAKAATKSS